MKFRNKDRLAAKLRLLRITTRQEVRRSLRQGAERVNGDAGDAIQEQTPSGVFVRSKGNSSALHEVSPRGSAPNADTGELHTSLTQVTKESASRIEVEAGANTPYAVRQELEFGRPYMRPAFHKNVERIKKTVRNSARRAVSRLGKASL